MSVTHVLITLVVACFVTLSSLEQARAGNDVTPLIPTYFRHISVQDGLSQVTVADILQDNHGFMWFATQNGINRYDGYSFIQYKRDKTRDGSGPVGEFSYKMALDTATSDIWVATSGGLSRYLYASDSFRHYTLPGADGKARLIVPTVVIDREGQVWAGTRQGLFRYDKVKDQFQAIPIAISEAAWVLDIEKDKSGHLLVATTEGLLAINIADPTRFEHRLKNHKVTDIVLLGSGHFWISTAGAGILSKPDGTPLLTALRQVDGLPDAIINSGVNAITQMNNGDIWLSANAGLAITRETQPHAAHALVKAGNANGLLSAAQMTRSFQSRSGLIWQGTWTSGFSIFDPDNLQIKSLNARPNTWVRGLEKDADENIWFGTPAGIWRRSAGRSIDGPWVFPEQQGVSGQAEQSNIRSIAYDKDRDDFWVGTTAGIYRLQPDQDRLEKLPLLEDATIFFLKKDNQGVLWAGTFNKGLYQIDPSTLSITGHWNVSTVTHVYTGDHDRVIAGTIEGLMLIDRASQRLTNLSAPSRPEVQRSPRVITWISKARDGGYWLGAQGAGVYKMTEQATGMQFTPIQPGSHLATLSVGALQEDQQGNLWVSTTEGIAHIDLAAGEISYYNKKNGAYSEGYYINHAQQTRTGEILFAGPKGLSYFFPQDIGLSDWKPPVVLTNLLVLNQPVKPSSEPGHPLDKPVHIADRIVLGPDDNVFSVEFSALDFSAPENNQYAFRLDGFDSDWNTAIARNRVATYTNLDPGRYVLQVRGTNKDHVWSDQIADVEILVTPPWYWTTWSKVLWLVLTLALFTLLYRWRIWALQVRATELSRLVEERTRALEESNAKLLTLSSLDELTGLKNRRDFRTHAEHEVERFRRTGRTFSVLMMDIDNFKQINDQRGHAVGDAVLVAAAGVMKNMVRKNDLLARWGGEEFIILATDTALEQARLMAEKIRTALEQERIIVAHQSFRITVTIGVSEIQSEQSLDDCINTADKRLYQGKREGRNNVQA
ncbi:ligand-binding sensor domain-containing protein [Alteromonas sp. CYL-A6]|uniref:ligand-binding sensor domain-containing protein n=1 Tax=Alteromonas nitratireducens TaxID=3390813 RepID=UPI0034B760D3